MRRSALTVEGETARYASSEALDRVFCKVCGTRLFSWRRNGTAAGVALATFDDRNAFAPTEHIWVSEKIDWVKIDDGLPQYPEVGAAVDRQRRSLDGAKRNPGTVHPLVTKPRIALRSIQATTHLTQNP